MGDLYAPRKVPIVNLGTRRAEVLSGLREILGEGTARHQVFENGQKLYEQYLIGKRIAAILTESDDRVEVVVHHPPSMDYRVRRIYDLLENVPAGTRRVV